MDFAGILTGIRETPVPNLLVAGGLVFLFLAVVGRIGAIIVVAEEKQKAAAVIGSLLLLLGLGLTLSGEVLNGGEEKTGTQTNGKKDLGALDGANLAAQSSEAWLTGDYDAALNLFKEMRLSAIDSSLRELATRRFEWLAPYSGSILFADDFQIDSLVNGSRWTTHPGAPVTGRGGASILHVDGRSVLRIEDHYHAEPRLHNSGGIHTFFIRMRYRAQSQESVGAHINLMMEEHEGRTTVGIYGESGELSVWETKDGREIGRKSARASSLDWQELRIAVKQQHIRIHLNNDLIIDYKSPRARPISLTGFNLEGLSGTIWFDDILMTKD